MDQWVHDSLDNDGVRVAELTPAVALDAGSIPRAALANPLDRLLVATARHLDAVLVTATNEFSHTSQTPTPYAFTTSTVVGFSVEGRVDP